MPWLTPDSIPEDDDCRPLSIPADSTWLALVSGALTELTKPYNWQQFGALTVDETVTKMQEIIDGYYAGGCACVLPGGSAVIRIRLDGHLEQLGDDGEWGEPTGEYYIPPPSAREEPTEYERKCLAAENAVNVLEQLYETLTEAWDANLSEAEAGTAFIVNAVGLIGFEFAPITFGIIIFLNVVFGVLYAALEYLGADLWTEDFSDQMVCFLLTCANDADGVVTFDWECFMGQLNSLTDSFGLSELQIRLYLQVAYMLYFIGGVDGLNLAGATNEITSAACACGWVACVDLTEGMEVFEFIGTSGGEWDGGIKPTVVLVGGDPARPRKQAYFQIPTLDSCQITKLEQFYTRTCGDNPGSFAYNSFAHNSYASILSVTTSCDGGPYIWSGTATITDLQANIASGGSDSGSSSLGDALLTLIRITGVGEPPSQLLPYLC